MRPKHSFYSPTNFGTANMRLLLFGALLPFFLGLVDAKPTFGLLQHFLNFDAPARFTQWRSRPVRNNHLIKTGPPRFSSGPAGYWKVSAPYSPYPPRPQWSAQVETIPAILVFEEHIPALIPPLIDPPNPTGQPSSPATEASIPPTDVTTPVPATDPPAEEKQPPATDPPVQPPVETPATETPDPPVVPEVTTAAPTVPTPSGEISPSASPDPSPPTSDPPAETTTEPPSEIIVTTPVEENSTEVTELPADDQPGNTEVNEIEEYSTPSNSYLPPSEVNKRDVNEIVAAETTTVKPVPLPAELEPTPATSGAQGAEDNMVIVVEGEGGGEQMDVRTLAKFVDELLELRAKTKGTAW